VGYSVSAVDFPAASFPSDESPRILNGTKDGCEVPFRTELFGYAETIDVIDKIALLHEVKLVKRKR
jgi:hypothetical protein